MPSVSKDLQSEQIARIRQIVVAKPDASLRQISEVMKENGMPLSINYIMKLLGKIRRERAIRYDNATAKRAIAEFEDMIRSTSGELLKIAKSSKVDVARIMALDTRIKHLNLLMEKQFDAGVFNRKLGTVETKFVNVAAILKLLKDERDQTKKLNRSKNFSRDNIVGPDTERINGQPDSGHSEVTG